MRRAWYLIGGTTLAVTWWLWRRVAPASAQGDRGVLDAQEARELYDQLAPSYDALASVYRLVGSRRLAEQGMRLLGLSPGDTVVDLGCGTGVNLPWLAQAVGPAGRVVGVDLSREMLDQARRRTADAPAEVDLVQQDVRDFAFPDGTAGVVATFALEMVPGYDQVIERACRALAPTEGRIAVMGLRRPPNWPRWAVALGIALGKPFGVSEAYSEFRPWEAVRHHAREVHFQTRAFGSVYLSVGEPGPE